MESNILRSILHSMFVLGVLTMPIIAYSDSDFTLQDIIKNVKENSNWTVPENHIHFKSDDWRWESIVLDTAYRDLKIEAIVNLASVDETNYSGNAAGIIFRKSDQGAAAFYIWMPFGGFAAQGEILGESKTWSKDQTFALSKDAEKLDQKLVVLVKEDLANFYVNEKLVAILGVSERKEGKVGIYAHKGAVFKYFKTSPIEPDVKLETKRPVRDLLFGGEPYISIRGWRIAVEDAAQVLNEAIAEGTEGVPGEEKMPAYTYRCVTYMKSGVRPFYAYPAFHHGLIIDALLDYYRFTKETKYLDEAIKLADWNIRNSTPSTDKIPNLPYSTTMNGKMGGEGNADGECIMIDKAGFTGQQYLRLWKLTKNDELKNAALRIAETLLNIQLPDGRWQNRVSNATGKVCQDYTSNQIFNIELMEQLYEITLDKRYLESSQKAWKWVLENPLKTYKWIGYYEDVAPEIKSVGNWDAIATARYLIKNKDKDSSYLAQAINLAEWIGTTFAVKQDGKWPLIAEQSICMPVMSCHTLHYALLLTDLAEATGESYWKNAAISAANAGFDLSSKDEHWYSLILSPLYFGLEIAERLQLKSSNQDL